MLRISLTLILSPQYAGEGINEKNVESYWPGND